MKKTTIRYARECVVVDAVFIMFKIMSISINSKLRQRLSGSRQINAVEKFRKKRHKGVIDSLDTETKLKLSSRRPGAVRIDIYDKYQQEIKARLIDVQVDKQLWSITDSTQKLEYYEYLITTYPFCAFFRLTYAMDLTILGFLDKAETMCSESIKLFPCFTGYISLGRIYIRSDKYELAAEMYRHAILFANGKEQKQAILDVINSNNENLMQSQQQQVGDSSNLCDGSNAEEQSAADTHDYITESRLLIQPDARSESGKCCVS